MGWKKGSAAAPTALTAQLPVFAQLRSACNREDVPPSRGCCCLCCYCCTTMLFLAVTARIILFSLICAHGVMASPTATWHPPTSSLVWLCHSDVTAAEICHVTGSHSCNHPRSLGLPVVGSVGAVIATTTSGTHHLLSGCMTQPPPGAA